MARAADPAKAKEAATWIVRRLREAGHIAYFAGGCVRDGLLGLHPTDFDVATDATPKRVQATFPHTAEVGAAFGVVLVHVSKEDLAGTTSKGNKRGTLVSVEVATFRSDGPYTDARRPDSVTFSDPESDAKRRDFTINALFLDPLGTPDETTASLGASDLQGRVIDYVGGVDDLRGRVLRAVGDPDKRLAEDHLRALRAVRFAARLGFTLDDATARAIQRHAAELRGVSRERIGDEMRRMLAHPRRADAIRTLQSLTLDAPVLTEDAVEASLRILCGLPASADVPTGLAAWAIDRAASKSKRTAGDWLSDVVRIDVIQRWRAALNLSNEENAQLTAILEGTWAITQRWVVAAGAAGMRVSQRKRLAAKPSFDRSLQIVRAWDAAVADRIEADLAALRADGVGIDPPSLVTGDDLVAAGMTPGPRFKGILDEVRDAQLEGRIRRKAEGLELARRLGVQP